MVSDHLCHAKGYLEKHSLMNVVKSFFMPGELIGGREGEWVHLKDHYVNGAAFGGLVGSARAFGRFLQDQLRPRSVLFGDATRQMFFAPQRARGEKAIPVTLGWHMSGAGGNRCFYKEGGGGGFHSMMRLYPICGIGTVIMTNATVADVGKMLDRLDSSFVA